MKVTLTLIAPETGEQDYTRTLDMPAVPQAGDIIHLNGEGGLAAFQVKATIWNVSPTDEVDVWVAAEYRDSPLASEAHKKAMSLWQARGIKIPMAPDLGV